MRWIASWLCANLTTTGAETTTKTNETPEKTNRARSPPRPPLHAAGQRIVQRVRATQPLGGLAVRAQTPNRINRPTAAVGAAARQRSAGRPSKVAPSHDGAERTAGADHHRRGLAVRRSCGPSGAPW